MKHEGFSYIFNLWNIIDLTNFLVNGAFLVYRLNKLDEITSVVVENIYVPENFKEFYLNYTKEDFTELSKEMDFMIDPVLCILSISIVFFSFLKVMFFLQAQENFGKTSVLV